MNYKYVPDLDPQHHKHMVGALQNTISCVRLDGAEITQSLFTHKHTKQIER